MTLMITGHRPDKLFGYDIKKEEYLVMSAKITEFIIAKGYTNFMTGMALGVDTVFAINVITLKKYYPTFHLECAIPCLGQSSLWNEVDSNRYDSILQRADKVTYVSNKPYAPIFMHRRNAYMVDNSTEVLAVWNGVRMGGTFNCIKYALKQGRPVYVLDPRHLTSPIYLYKP